VNLVKVHCSSHSISTKNEIMKTTNDSCCCRCFSVFLGRYYGAKVAVKKVTSVKDGSPLAKYVSRELELLRFLNHPNLVHYIGMALHQGLCVCLFVVLSLLFVICLVVVFWLVVLLFVCLFVLF
jgi:serine/threonine protein kinase